MVNFLFEIAYKVRDFFGSFISSNLLWLQLGSLVLSGLFVWGIVYILTKVHYFNLKKEHYIDFLGFGDLFRYRSVRSWNQIKKKLASDNPDDWKEAILESDRILNEILKMSGYIGNDLKDKLAEMSIEQLPSLEEIKKVHETANMIKIDLNFPITQEIVLEIIGVYRKAFIKLHLIDQ